jgi:hypothetical protein
MTGLVYTNFAKTTLSGSISNTAVSIALASGSGSLFPALTGNQYFIGVLTDAATQLNHEIVKVTARSGDTVTVVRAQEGTTALNWSAGDYFANLVTAGGLSTFNQFVYNSWDLSAAPSTDVLLNAGDRANITFSSVSSIPLRIQTVPGFYKMYLAITANNSSNSDLFLYPNNTTYSNSFSRYSIEAIDYEVTGFGSATSDVTVTPITGGVTSFSASIPSNQVVQNLDAFFIDMFAGPSVNDTVNDRGPFVADFLISTFTAAKVFKSTGAILGGAHVASSIWSDTVTAWTSLGSLSVSLSGGGPSGSMATVSGVAVVERIA